MSNLPFSTLNLKPDLLRNLDSFGYKTMTPVQAQSLPYILDGRDVIAQGKTGSGKTAAFGLGLLQKLEVKRFRIQSLVLCPTRELADQVAKECRRLARTIHNIKILTICGGMPFGPQVGSLEHGAHIIVGTPGRIEDHLKRGTLSLQHVSTLVLDEADRMLEMGFQSALDAIVAQITLPHQTLLFSATFPEQIKQISQKIMTAPQLVKVESTHHESTISQHFYKVDDERQRINLLRLILQQQQPESAVVFCNTKKETQQVADKLNSFGFHALALHGDLEQRERDQTLVRFVNRSITVLVATDVAARGLDIDSMDVVINYHIAHDTEVHIHRIGRTGRAGSKGVAFSLFGDKDDYRMRCIGEHFAMDIEGEAWPPQSLLQTEPVKPLMATLQIDGGKKQKVRPGDILGALTGDNGITAKQVGRIQIFDNWAFVAVSRDAVKAALKKLNEGKLKGRSFRTRLI